MDRERYRQRLLAGTVTFPATLPRLAELTLTSTEQLPVVASIGVASSETLVVATERPSPRVSIVRSVSATEIRAVFLPKNPAVLDWNQGVWLLQSEILPGLQMHLNSGDRLFGILYVPEFSPTLLEVQTGMTAAESAQYYPPLPCDRSQDHYQAGAAKQSNLAAQSLSRDPGGFMPREFESPCDSYTRSTQAFEIDELRDPHLDNPTLMRSSSMCDDGFLDRDDEHL
ncbi:hypothetical protein SH528x_001484 [Novipirellula sp. SH528]|uniref:hypothetical protein n=1 Tax=Novipirellula sp. SH528 TaxID=3454466 RepID=UPI003F9FB480